MNKTGVRFTDRKINAVKLIYKEKKLYQKNRKKNTMQVQQYL